MKKLNKAQVIESPAVVEEDLNDVATIAVDKLAPGFVRKVSDSSPSDKAGIHARLIMLDERLKLQENAMLALVELLQKQYGLVVKDVKESLHG